MLCSFLCWSLAVVHMGPAECVCEAGREGRLVLGLNAAGCVWAGQEERTDYAESLQAHLNCRTPYWHLQRLWWHSAAPADGTRQRHLHNWEPSGKMACSSEHHDEGLRVGSEWKTKRKKGQSQSTIWFRNKSIFKLSCKDYCVQRDQSVKGIVVYVCEILTVF